MAFKDYYALTKPGLVYGNVITVIGGVVVASHAIGAPVDLWLLIAAIVGTSLVMASGCVFNNFIDRDVDAHMARTRDRVLVAGRISGRSSIIYGTCLGFVGFLTLILWTNLLAATVAAVGFFAYVFLYSMWGKRASIYGPIIGSISGATPPVIGYCAASDHFDAGAIILFAILVLWQIPHFYAISIYRFDDYAAAKIPVMPIVKGIRATKVHMLLYVIAFIFATLALTVFGYAGQWYAAIALALGLVWFMFALKGVFDSDVDSSKPNAVDKLWARQMFFLSLIVMVALFITISFS